MLDDIARLRRFNRAVTREVGALDTSFLGRGRPLGAARVLQLVQPDGTDVALIRERLALDSGLTSRFLRSLEQGGLIVCQRRFPSSGKGPSTLYYQPKPGKTTKSAS